MRHRSALRFADHSMIIRPSREQGPTCVTGGAFPRKVGGDSTADGWPTAVVAKDGRVATSIKTRAFGPRLRRLTALTALATLALLIATKRPTARCGQSVCKCHAEKSRSANFARILPPFTTWLVGQTERYAICDHIAYAPQ